MHLAKEMPQMPNFKKIGGKLDESKFRVRNEMQTQSLTPSKDWSTIGIYDKPFILSNR